jgi:hypothetical protein
MYICKHASCFCSLLQPELDYTSGYGGAVYVFAPAAETVVRNCTFTQNETPISGGALFLNSTAVIDGCTFAENSAVSGVGAAVATHMTLTLTNSNFSRNSAREVSATAESAFTLNLPGVRLLSHAVRRQLLSISKFW